MSDETFAGKRISQASIDAATEMFMDMRMPGSLAYASYNSNEHYAFTMLLQGIHETLGLDWAEDYPTIFTAIKAQDFQGALNAMYEQQMPQPLEQLHALEKRFIAITKPEPEDLTGLFNTPKDELISNVDYTTTASISTDQDNKSPLRQSFKTAEQGHYTTSHRNDLVRDIKLREGYRADVYKDGKTASGKQLYSVGWGHQALPRDNLKFGDTITKERATQFLQKDIEAVLNNAKTRAAELGVSDQPKFINALAKVAYQNGKSWHKDHKKTYALMMDGKYEEAAKEAQNSLWAKQTPARLKDFQTALYELQKAVDEEQNNYAANETLEASPQGS